MTELHNQKSSRDGAVVAPAAAMPEAGAPAKELHIPSLDGIRAISFFIVFVSHAGLGNIVPGGFGVTVFFLLSGFLITTLLRFEYARNMRIWLGGFYMRRALRILPPLYVSLALAAVLYRLGPGHPAIPFAGTLAQVLQVSNFYQIFATPAVMIPGTGVLWSLAVEEHFYLLFPLLYLWMSSRLTPARQASLLLALCAAALAWRCVLRFHFHADISRTFYATDARFDSILLGCIFAIVANPVFSDPLHTRMLRSMKWLLPASALVMLATLLLRNDNFRETLRYTLQGLALIPLFVAAIHYQSAWPVRVLNLRFVRFLGVLSYSLYLCHHVILESLSPAFPDQLLVRGAVALALSMCFATAVHFGIERPCAAQRKKLSRAFNRSRVTPQPRPAAD